MKNNTAIIPLLLLFLFAIASCSQNLQNSDSNYSALEMEETQMDNQNTIAIIDTDYGIIKVRLDQDTAPISVKNFKHYASSGFYNNTIFHRVIPGFMIQGGGFSEDGSQKQTKDPIKNEADNGISNSRGTISMARTNVIDSATSQFFINLVDNPFLDYRDSQNYGYAVFGKVIEGMDVVDSIAKVQTGSNGPHQDWPIEPVHIKSVTISE